ncbi:hypothetical protein [Bacilliculturomica massiliensis]|uniref:hypothetical protein n=1 Tax=Bacilliculturomica massiliensis TaxID=1917867 RepID=UPI0010320400|nr:hypothetical protein [Bacilliculturomica massiliensis]
MIKKRKKTLAAAGIVILLLLLSPIFVSAGRAAGLTMPIYGNCCNLSYTNNGEPIDFLDAQCSIYNEAWQIKGGFDPQAARELVRAVKPKISQMSGSTQTVAGLVTAYFDVRLFLSGQ